MVDGRCLDIDQEISGRRLRRRGDVTELQGPISRYANCFHPKLLHREARHEYISSNALILVLIFFEGKMDLRQVFDDLVRFETDLWNAVDARLRSATGVPLGTFNVLLVVASTEACRVNDIAEKLAITVGGASQAVDRIEQKGLCRRQQDSSDGRSSIISLAPLGKSKLAEASPVFDDELRQWLNVPGTQKEMQHFTAVLARLRAAAAQRNKPRS
jgi:DNA-binding MarR family transcriptional regulator